MHQPNNITKATGLWHKALVRLTLKETVICTTKSRKVIGKDFKSEKRQITGVITLLAGDYTDTNQAVSNVCPTVSGM